MNKEYLKEHNLIESQRQFRKLCEYTFIGADDILSEDDFDDDNQNVQQGEDNQSQTPENMNNQQPPMANDNSMNNVGNGEMNNQQPQQTIPQSEPQMPVQPQTIPNMNGTDDEVIDMESDEEVIDVEDLTDAQEDIDIKVGEVNSKIDKLLSTIETLDSIIQKNDAKIEDLKHEIETRNPTPTEKLNLRSLDSYPFNVNPKDYWDSKAQTSNYRAYSNNDMPSSDEDEEYIITQDEIDGDNDFKSISDSLDDEDLHQDFKKIFGY